MITEKQFLFRRITAKELSIIEGVSVRVARQELKDLKEAYCTKSPKWWHWCTYNRIPYEEFEKNFNSKKEIS